MLGPLEFLILDPLGGPVGPTPPPAIPFPVITPVNVGWPFTYGQVKAELALRLDDASNIFWTSQELGLYINEALRFFALCSGFWRERGTFNTTARMPYYDINQLLSNGSFNILQPTVTDQQIIQYIQYHMLETTSSQSQWNGTEMFNYNAIANAVQNRLNQFLGDTGCVVNRAMVAVVAPPAFGREAIDLKTIDVRHASWWDTQYYTTLWRTDERDLTAAGSPTWSISPGIPDSYSVMAPPPLQIQLSPPPIANGGIELLTVDSTTLMPSTKATVLGIPDNVAAAVKWGAMADLLGQDGIARDPIRATYCEQQYALYVQLTRIMPVILHTEINGFPLIPVTLQEVEASDPYWENRLDTPSDVMAVAPNLVGLSPVPDGIYSVTCDVVRAAPIPVSDGDTIRLTRELVDMILDYAEHLALFKVFGMEWHATDRAMQNFMKEALTFNQRISASARNSVAASDQSERQKQGTPRRLPSGSGVGSLRNA